MRSHPNGQPFLSPADSRNFLLGEVKKASEDAEECDKLSNVLLTRSLTPAEMRQLVMSVERAHQRIADITHIIASTEIKEDGKALSSDPPSFPSGQVKKPQPIWYRRILDSWFDWIQS